MFQPYKEETGSSQGNHPDGCKSTFISGAVSQHPFLRSYDPSYSSPRRPDRMPQIIGESSTGTITCNNIQPYKTSNSSGISEDFVLLVGQV